MLESNLLKISMLELEREIYSRSFFKFFSAAMQILEPETEWEFNWHIEYACDLMQEEIFRLLNKEPKTTDYVFNFPPGSSKSSLFSVCLTPWAWLHVPWLRVASASYNADLSAEHTRRSRDLILSAWYQELFGDRFKLTKSTETYFINDYGGLRRSGAETGRHFDIIVGDDLLNPKLAESEAERKNANDFWFKTVPSRFKDLKVGLKIVVQQRLHEEDICGFIREKKLKYRFVIIPAELTEDVEPKELEKYYQSGLFWPTRFPRQVLEEKKGELTEAEYTGQYLQRPSPAEGLIFKKSWLGLRFKPLDLPENIARHFYTDSAYGRPDGAKSATICWSVWKGKIYIWDVLVSGKGFTEWCDEYKDFVKLCAGDYRSAHYVEAKASGFDIEDVLSNSTGFNVILDNLPSDQSKKMRAIASTPTVRAGRVLLLENGVWVQDFIDELTTYDKGRYADQVDALGGVVRNSDLDYFEGGENQVSEVHF